MKKILAALSFSLMILMGCSQEDDLLVVGTNATFPPFEYIGGPSGDEIMGFDIDIAKQIAADTGKTLKIENMNFDSLIVALNSGKIDLILAGMTITEDRAKNVDFSAPYYEATQVVITRKDSDDISTIKDIENKKIAVQLGTTGDLMARAFSDKVVAFNTGFEALMELKNAKVDLILFDIAPAMKYLEKNPELELQKMDFTPEYYGIAVTKGNTELLNQINKTLENMQQNGQFDALLLKHMQ